MYHFFLQFLYYDIILFSIWCLLFINETNENSNIQYTLFQIEYELTFLDQCEDLNMKCFRSVNSNHYDFIDCIIQQATVAT